ncbi:UDP-N-acetylenolpyruvoylglucosamine reductase [Sporosarcina sp. P20a]|uniref:UDP-N-acetylmuramate dehydrogenase n=1 Tax=unclassified Sporosarcina TaxID=2647733 RepID=UPI000C170FBD|nr:MULTISPECIES: UDP-N-acetylmuramate dehydrogenase [unclassified Sporosarcina]PIC86413.1 UDP-N-acetylenolpyruvoylglucosamine reductase [Sporosarcina sp. P20a]PID06164.1 UDP-N-acetylenolpyruvoylglucosamine reductase [Sporosarcina sp. P30]PID09358.1 UDP-N-acetylenolpyruvoylglucosamine reductase [Sporosarcina sp. P31]PID12657.1 UDP-N-acetylenolpyruvoylglucosamine reductase [Sporosarcina sp. P32b]
MSKHRWFEDLQKNIKSGWLLLDEPLNKYTKTRLGGKADVVAAPGTIEEVQSVVSYAYNHEIPILLLGNGSNMVVRDGGVRGIVMYMANLNDIKIDGNRMIAEAGANIIDASREAATACLTGLEFACGIPGSIGGAMAMNAGAYGGEIKDIIHHATVMDETGKIFELSKEELELGYRKSIITTEGYYVLSAEFWLSEGEQCDIDAAVADLTFQRESKQPLEYPSAGSVFKRPPGYFAGKLIQDSGLQGKGFGGAEVSTKHAGFIVNKNNATAADYIQTIDMVKAEVKKNFGVDLEMEVKIVGEELSE